MSVGWPPSPSVEDEETALAKEHDLRRSLEQLKTDNQEVVTKGSIDQYPIIIDSDDNKSDTDSLKTVTPSRRSAREPHSSAVPVPTIKKNNILPPTPPTSSEDVRESVKDFDPVERASRSSVPRSKSTTRLGDRSASKGRPQVARIQTDVHDVPRMNASARRAPSPYTYSKETGTVRVDPKTRYSGEHFLSPTHATASPQSLHPAQKPDRSSEQQVKTETHSIKDQLESRKIRFNDESHLSDSGVDRPKRSSRDVINRPGDRDTASRSHTSQSLLTPPGSRRQSKEYPTTTNREERPNPQRMSDYSSYHKGTRVTESPYTSSAEESVKSSKARDHKSSDNEDRRTRKQSTNRRERPRFEESFDPLNLQRFRGFSDDERPRRHRRETSLRSPLASPLVETPSAIEDDYFARAFQENQKRTQSRGLKAGGDDSVLISPPTSPPRTPKSERTSQDYFSPMSATTARPVYRSREPSLDENQIKDQRTHSSLLSQATTGAAIAARVAPSLSRSSTATLETPSDSSSSKNSTRKPSPSYEEVKSTKRSDVRTLQEESRSPRPSVSQPSSRPSTRDGPVYHDPVPYDHHGLPPRTSSYSGYDHPYQGAKMMQFGPPLNTANIKANSLSVPKPQESLIQRSKSFAGPPPEMTSTSSDWQMPACPRSIPTSSYRDWYTFKEFSNIDLCPSCVDAIFHTRFRSFLVRSLDKPYNEKTTCAMSNPWVRVAFEHAVKQHKHDLRQVREVLTPLPPEVRPCSGSLRECRKWWSIRDTATMKPIPDFFICSACMMNVDTVFPDLKSAFERDTIQKERFCNLDQSNKHFEGMVDQFEQTNDRCHKGGFKAKYTESLVSYAKRISQNWGCCRDIPFKTRAWHFTPDLPEFTICEECYRDVVWPLRDRFIARDICKTLKVPPSKVTGKDGNSCQLYSDRMRYIFNTAVNERDFDYLKTKVRERLDVQHRLREMTKMYDEDRKLGWDRATDIQRNKEMWRLLE